MRARRRACSDQPQSGQAWRSARGALLALLLTAAVATPVTQAQSASDAGAGEQDPSETFPAEHVPKVTLKRDPPGAVRVGEKLRLTIEASALEGDDVTVPEQAFAPLELVAKAARVVPAQDGRQSFVFDLDFIGLSPGAHALEGIELSVVTRTGLLGRTKTDRVEVEVKSLIGNEPNAQLRDPTSPVTVMQDDYTLLYVGGGLLAAALLALLTVLVYRYLQRREKPLPPPPPPRPPWEVAIEKLGELRRNKAQLLAAGEAARFVDLVSDVVRAYLGGRFGFDGLETTSDEMLAALKRAGAGMELYGEVGAFLRRCDLVKFAKVEPSADEADWVLLKAHEIVQLGEPRAGSGTGAAPSSTPVEPGAGA